MSLLYYRRYQWLMFLFTLLLFFMAFYLQYVHDLHPCPLCMVQRFCGYLVSLLCLVGIFLVSYRQAKIITVFQLMFSAAGLFFAGRQLWLQSLPMDQVPACLPGFDVMLRYFPWRDLLLALFWGSGDCAEAAALFLGVSLPAWSALSFVTLLFGSGFIFFRLETRPNDH